MEQFPKKETTDQKQSTVTGGTEQVGPARVSNEIYPKKRPREDKDPTKLSKKERSGDTIGEKFMGLVLDLINYITFETNICKVFPNIRVALSQLNCYDTVTKFVLAFKQQWLVDQNAVYAILLKNCSLSETSFTLEEYEEIKRKIGLIMTICIEFILNKM